MAAPTVTLLIAITFADGTVGRGQFFVDDTEVVDIDALLDKRDYEEGTVVSWRAVLTEDFPADDTFRSAWRDSGSAISVDMPAARVITLERYPSIDPGAVAAATTPAELIALFP